MRLVHHAVRGAGWGAATRLDGGRLTVARDALLAELAAAAPEVAWGAEWALPGSAARITRALDVLEPRWRRDGPTFPGWDGPAAGGAGAWEVLDGLAVVVSGRRGNTQQAVIDLFGPGAEATPFGRHVCLVLRAQAAPALPDEAFDRQVRLAGLRAARWLAERAAGGRTGRAEELSWEPEGPAPRVGYALYLQSQGLFRETFVYGRPAAEVGPLWLSPTQVLGGAVVSGNYVVACQKNPTFLHGRNPVVRALLAEHGRRLTFAGVAAAPEVSDPRGKEAVARRVAELAAEAGLAGMIVTQEGGGNADADLMLACRALAERGVAAVLLARECAGAEGDAWGLVDWVEEAVAVVSTGNADAEIDLPAAQRVVTAVAADESTHAGPLRLPLAQLYAATNQLGALGLRAVTV